jgi:hypothetical protein
VAHRRHIDQELNGKVKGYQQGQIAQGNSELPLKCQEQKRRQVIDNRLGDIAEITCGEGMPVRQDAHKAIYRIPGMNASGGCHLPAILHLPRTELKQPSFFRFLHIFALLFHPSYIENTGKYQLSKQNFVWFV